MAAAPEAGDPAFETREETSKYFDLMPDGTARQFTFVMEAKSVITFPSGGQRLAARILRDHRPRVVGTRRIARVDVSTDGGATGGAALQQPVCRGLTRFRPSWHWDGGPARFKPRVDETGYVQPTRRRSLDVRGSFHLSQQRDSDVAGRADGRDQCL